MAKKRKTGSITDDMGFVTTVVGGSKVCPLYPQHSGAQRHFIMVVNVGREYLVPIKVEDLEVEHLSDEEFNVMMENNCAIYETDKKHSYWIRHTPTPTPKKEQAWKMPQSLASDEVREWDETIGKTVIRKKIYSTRFRGDSYELNQELKQAKSECADDEIAEIKNGEIKVRKRKKRKADPVLKAALKKAKEECAKDETVEVIDGKVIVRKKIKRRGARGQNYELNQELLRAKEECAKDEIAEIVDGKIVTRKKKPKGRRSRGTNYELNQELITVKAGLDKGKVAEIVDGEIVIRESMKGKGKRKRKNL